MNFMLLYLVGLHTESEVGQPNTTSFTDEPHHQTEGNCRGYMKSSAAGDFRDMYVGFPIHKSSEKLAGSIQTVHASSLVISLNNNNIKG